MTYEKDTLNDTNRIRAIIAAIATIGAVGIAIGLGTPLVSAMMMQHGIPTSIIGYSGTIGGLATILAASCTARIAMRFGVVKPILIMLIIGALSFLGFYYFQGLWVWFILRFTLHFAMTIMFILSEFWVNSSAPPHKRGAILAIYAATFGLGFSLGPILFSYVGSSGFLPFGIGCLLIICASVPIASAWKLSPHFKNNEHTEFFPFIFKVPTATMAVLVYGAIQMGAVTLMTPFSQTIGYSEAQAGHFLTLLALGNVLLLIPIGMISDKLSDRRYALSGCAIIGFIGTLSVPYIMHYYYLLGAVLFILGGVSAGLYTIGLAQLGAKLKGSDLAAANSAFIFCYGIGMLIGPTIIGQAMEMYPTTGFSMAMALFFGLYVTLVTIRLILRLTRS